VVSVTESGFWSGWGKRSGALRNIPPVMKMVWKSGPRVVISALLLRTFAALLPVGMLYVSKRIVDQVVASSKGTHQIGAGFWWLVGLEFALALLASITTHSMAYFDGLFADRFTRHVSLSVMEHASKLDLASYEDPVFQDKLDRARAQATDRIAMVREFGVMVQQILTAVTLSASIAVFSPWLLLLLIGCLIPAFLGESHFAFLGYSLNFSQTHIRRQMDYVRVLGSSKETAKEMKLFGLKRFLVGRYTDLSNQLYQQNRGLAGRKVRANALLSILSTAGYYSAYAWVIWRTVSGELSVGTMTFLAGAIAGASTNIQMLFSSFSSIADQSLFLTDLQEFFKVMPAIRNVPNAIPVPRVVRSGFEFRNVCFRYPGRDGFVLENLNLRWDQGERLALIGANGQGKTTIVKLITRLYDPTEGQILLDGIDLREYRLEDLSSQVSAVMQDFVKYDMTVSENIGIGCIEDRYHFSKLREAAEKSVADHVIEKLPHGYDQLLGRRFEGGVDLSGGEWQRIALARAYIRNAQILILDEPTAALDAKAENEVFERFNDLTEGKMALFISHRFSTVKMADRIVVLENGRVAEEGNHQQLMALGRRYYEMFEMQAASYR
jgi:ATP-binding cassette, subfamily B, bacterial